MDIRPSTSSYSITPPSYNSDNPESEPLTDVDVKGDFHLPAHFEPGHLPHDHHFLVVEDISIEALEIENESRIDLPDYKVERDFIEEGIRYQYRKEYAQAKTLYEQAAESGDPVGWAKLAELYAEGLGVEKNPDEVARLLALVQASAKAENPPGQCALGYMHECGQGVEKNDVEAAKLYYLSAKQGDARALFSLGLMYAEGRGVEKDYAKATELYYLSAKQGNAVALFQLGLIYLEGGGVEQDDAKAAKLFGLSAKQNYSAAQCNLGLMYADGRGVEQDDVKAAEFYCLSAKQGHSTAQCNLALMYLDGRGVEQDDVKAAEFYYLSAKQGDPKAQFNLGTMYLGGRGVEQDDVEAVKFLRLSAKQGDARALFRLAWMYEFGRGVEQDDVEAVRLYRLSAEQGDTEALCNLGVMYECDRGVEKKDDARAMGELAWLYVNGYGVKQDNSQAIKYYRLAITNGFTDAIPGLQSMAEKNQSDAQLAMGEFSIWLTVCRNYGKAELYLKNAFASGLKAAGYGLGLLHEYGLGQSRNIKRAVDYYQAAANTGCPLAKLAVGVCQLRGLLGDIDEENVLSLLSSQIELAADPNDPIRDTYANLMNFFRKVAKRHNGSIGANLTLALVYQHGMWGVFQDENNAFQYLKRAAELGDPWAKRQYLTQAMHRRSELYKERTNLFA